MLGILLILIVIGVALWALTTYVPIAQPIKGIIVAVVVIAVLIWLLSVFGLLGGDLYVPHAHRLF